MLLCVVEYDVKVETACHKCRLVSVRLWILTIVSSLSSHSMILISHFAYSYQSLTLVVTLSSFLKDTQTVCKDLKPESVT